MFRYLVRRITTTLVVLVGILLVTFLLVHLAPGDPVTSGLFHSGKFANGREQQPIRRFFNLHLPIFFNFDPQDIKVRTTRWVTQLGQSGENAERAEQSIIACGTLCFLYIETDNLSATQKVNLATIVDLFERSHPELFAGKKANAQAKIERVRLAIRADKLAERLRQNAAQGRSADIMQHWGSAAVPVAVAHLDNPDKQISTYANKLLGLLTAHRAERTFWNEWWHRYRWDYTAMSAQQRLLATVVETRFGKWVYRLSTFSFGYSMHDGVPVWKKLKAALPVTILLGFLSMSLAYLLGVPLGVWAAVKRNSNIQRAFSSALFFIYALPNFWVAMALILLFGGVGMLDWFPIHGLQSSDLENATGWVWFSDRVAHLVLPIVVMSYGSFAVIYHHQKSATLSVLDSPFILAARSRGLKGTSIFFKHALRNALIPTITLWGLHVPVIIGGSVIVEKIFNIPGMGLLTFDAYLHRDYPVIMAITLLAALVTLIAMNVADLVYRLADPRIVWGKSE